VHRSGKILYYYCAIVVAGDIENKLDNKAIKEVKVKE